MVPISPDELVLLVADGASISIPPDHSVTANALAEAFMRANMRRMNLLDVPLSGLAPAAVPETPEPTDTELALLSGAVCEEMLETYPDFCRRVWARSKEQAA